MKKISKINKRQNELLTKYYNLDPDTNTINLFYHYENASDILDINVGNSLYPTFKNEVLEKINENMENSNPTYKVRLNFEIENYESYSPKNIIESFNDTLELKQYATRRKRQLKNLLCSVFVLIGTLVLLVNAIISRDNLIKDETNAKIIGEILNITAWVFIWEAVSMFFIEHYEQTKFALKIKKNVSEIAFYKKGEKAPLSVETEEEIFGKWENEARIKKTGKAFILISSFVFIFLAFYSIYESYNIIKTYHTAYSLILIIIILIFSFTIPFLAGIGGISLYLDKNEKIKKFVGFYAIFLTISILISVISAITSKSLSFKVSTAISLIINIFYILGYFIDKKTK